MWWKIVIMNNKQNLSTSNVKANYFSLIFPVNFVFWFCICTWEGHLEFWSGTELSEAKLVTGNNLFLTTLNFKVKSVGYFNNVIQFIAKSFADLTLQDYEERDHLGIFFFVT